MTPRFIARRAAVAIAIGAIAVAAVAQDARPADGAAGAQRAWLPIPQVVEKVEAAGFREIEEIERESGSYEVKALDRRGERVKLRVNPRTGEVVDQRDRDAKRGTNAERARRDGVECNKRRCRDDVPQPTRAPAPGN